MDSKVKNVKTGVKDAVETKRPKTFSEAIAERKAKKADAIR